MCGIAGYVWRDRPAKFELVKSMCDRIRHRGPDDEGFHVEGGCAIGMRRLSIIDLSTGHQPIPNEDRTLWVVFNGEIYNYQPLRQDLIAKGHRFQTNSDTETLIHLCEQEGRDGLYFGSEIECLREAGVPLDTDQEALRLYFQFNYIPDPLTAFRAIRKLPASGWMEYSQDGTLRQGTYWKLPEPASQPPAGLSEEEARRRLRDEFDEAVRIRMMADVPLGAFLSGGIDSSSVVASMALQSKEPVKTFSIGFEEAAYNELSYAALVAKKYGTDHHEILVRPDSANLVPKLVRHFGEPFGDSSAIPTYLVSEFAVQHVKVALSGDGGDELFAGYESFAAMERLRKFDLVPEAVRWLLARAAELLPYAAYGKNYLRMISRPNALERYFEYNYAPWFMRRRLLQPEWMLPADGAFLIRTMAGCLPAPGAGILTQAMYFEATANLTGDMLVKVDRMSMANSLEVRSPLLDHELAELAATIPHAWKFNRTQGKRILIEALGDRLPPALLNRPKWGFGVPLADWFRGSLREFLWDNVTAPQFLERGIVSPEFLRA